MKRKIPFPKLTYSKVAVGGTFDRLHKGHRTLLQTAFSLGQFVIIGLTADSMITGKTLSTIIEPFSVRKRHVQIFLKKHNFIKRARIVTLTDSFGPVLSDRTIQAVVVGPRVSPDTIKKITAVKPVVTCQTIYSSDGSYLSSTRIRRGKVSRTGTIYAIAHVDLHMPSTLKKLLRKPLGRYIQNPRVLTKPSIPLIVSIGDASMVKLISHQIYPAVIVVDGMIQKKKVFSEAQIKKLAGNSYQFVRVTNLAGTVTSDLVSAMQHAFNLYVTHNKQTIIYIRGEDDLAVLPAVYGAPLSSRVVYGQPPIKGFSKPGMISITVSEKTKHIMGALIRKFNES